MFVFNSIYATEITAPETPYAASHGALLQHRDDDGEEIDPVVEVEVRR
jgi:hypothetical protein